MPEPHPPPVPTELLVLNRTADSIEISWKCQTASSLSQLEITWNNNIGVFQATSPQKIEELISAHSPSFLSNCFYQVRVRSVNDDGVSDWSDMLTTASLPPTPPKLSLCRVMIDSRTRLSWDIHLDSCVNLQYPLFVEIFQSDLNGHSMLLLDAERLMLKGKYILQSPVDTILYFLRLFSEMPSPLLRNESQNGPTVLCLKRKYGSLQIPSLQEASLIRTQQLRQYYGRR